MRPLFDNSEIVDLVELFPDFEVLRGQQFTEYRTDTHVGKIIACTANRAGARGIISVLRMIERLLHEPGERLRALRTDRLTDQFNELRIQLQKGPTPAA